MLQSIGENRVQKPLLQWEGLSVIELMDRKFDLVRQAAFVFNTERNRCFV